MYVLALPSHKGSFLFKFASYYFLCIMLTSITCRSQKLQCNAEFGLQKSCMDWSISKNDQESTLSRLKWKEVNLFRYDFSIDYHLSNRCTAGSNFSLFNTHSGSVRDIDYSEHAPYGITSDEKYSAKKGNGNDLFLNLKYSLINSINQEKYLRLVCGFYSHYQYFSLLGSIYQNDDLNSFYKNRWIGGILGIMGKLTAGKFSFIEKADFGFLTYNAKANWNLIEEFSHPSSFKHKANGYMYASNSSINYMLGKKMNILYRFSIKNMKTWKGEDILFYKNGIISYSRLNEVNQLEYNNNIGVSFIF